MAKRANAFLNKLVLPLLAPDADDRNTIAVASHGIFLDSLCNSFFARLDRKGAITIKSKVEANKFGAPIDPFKTVGRFNNTGYLELEVTPGLLSAELPNTTASGRTTLLPGYTVSIETVNGQKHLEGQERDEQSDLAYAPIPKAPSVVVEDAPAERIKKARLR
jgi:hypothetical protein